MTFVYHLWMKHDFPKLIWSPGNYLPSELDSSGHYTLGPDTYSLVYLEGCHRVNKTTI